MTHIDPFALGRRRAPTRPPVLEHHQWIDRRRLLRSGLGGAALGAASLLGCRGTGAAGADYTTTEYPPSSRWIPGWRPPGGAGLYPAPRNPAYAVQRALTPETATATHNNFYEFLPGGGGPVHRHLAGFEPLPWSITIGGEIEEPRTVDLDEIPRIAPLEERLYAFRCVEAWSMVVPWIGIPLAKFVAWCKPRASATHVRFVSFGERDPSVERARRPPDGFRSASHYPWPFYEALRMDEALHPLSLLVTGIYGHGLPMQNGAPVRVVVPWKYGYKSPKSIVHIEPPTFWNDLYPGEYDFPSNVNPSVPHPRWSQATETDLATGDRLPTLLYNGYGAEVSHLYS